MVVFLERDNKVSEDPVVSLAYCIFYPNKNNFLLDVIPIWPLFHCYDVSTVHLPMRRTEGSCWLLADFTPAYAQQYLHTKPEETKLGTGGFGEV